MANLTTRMPRLGMVYLRALTQRARGGLDDAPFTEMSIAVPAVRVDAERLAAYRRVCGYPEASTLPPLYPQVLATSLQAALLTSPAFPLRALGLVHLRNVVRALRPIEARQPLDLCVRLGERRRVVRGLEVDLELTVHADGALAADATSTTLFVDRHRPPGERARPVESALPVLERSTVWRLPADLGRRYARASGDYNPIHLWPLTAKLFGFRRAIAHGMWSISRAVAELDDDLPAFPLQIAAELKRPILLPSRVSFSAGRGELAVRSVDGRTLHLTGRCSSIRTPHPPGP